MSSMAAELEGELELEGETESDLTRELVHEHELQPESEHEQEQEHEAFFNHLAAMADRFGRPQSLRRIALAAARSALRANARPYRAVEGEAEMEGEFEGAGLLELEAGPTERAHAAAMMEHTGHAAAEAANEQEAAEHFLPLIGLAAKLVAPKLIGMAGKIGGKLIGKVGSRLLRRVGPRLVRRIAPRVTRRVVSRVLGRAAPRLTRAVGNVTRTLYRSPATRPLLHAMPRIARGTMGALVRRTVVGRPITPRLAVRQFARQTAKTLSNPRVLNQIYRRSLVLDRRFHRNSRRVLGRPVGPIVRAGITPTTVAGGIPYGIATPALTTGGCNCRCVCQPAVTSAVAIPTPVTARPVSVPTPFGPAPIAVCPTCGR